MYSNTIFFKMSTPQVKIIQINLFDIPQYLDYNHVYKQIIKVIK
jgi:hypothetical protein